MSKNYERFGCGQTPLAVPVAQKHPALTIEDTRCLGSKEIMRNRRLTKRGMRSRKRCAELACTQRCPQQESKKSMHWDARNRGQIQAAEQVIIRYTL